MKDSNLKKNMITNIVFQLANIFYGLVLPKVIIVSYGSEMNGIVSGSLQLVGYMKIVEAGLSTASIKQFYDPIVKKNKDKISDLFLSVNYYYKKIANHFIILSIISAIGYSFLVTTTLDSFHVFLLVIVISLNTYFDFAFATKYYIYFVANKEIYKYQFAQIFAQILKIIVVVFCSSFNMELVLILTIVSFIVLVKTYILKLYFKREDISVNQEKGYVLVQIEQKNAILTHQLLGLVIYNSPIILISILIGAEAASIFSIYILIFGTFYGFYSLIYGQTILPQFGHLISGKQHVKLVKAHNKFNQYSLVIITAIMITTIITLESFLEIYTKNGDIEYYFYTISILFTGYTFFNCIKVPYQTLINANGDFKKTIRYSFIETFIFVVIVVSLSYRASINVFVFALLISSVYKAISLKIYVNKNILQETVGHHVYQVLSLILVISAMYLESIYDINVANALEWVIYSSIIFVLSVIVSVIVIIMPAKLMSFWSDSLSN